MSTIFALLVTHSLISNLGTIRSNLDPFSVYDDARLWDALRRSYLVDPAAIQGERPSDNTASGTSIPSGRFSLDTVIEAEGANLSVGERSLLSLARALVKNSKVVGEHFSESYYPRYSELDFSVGRGDVSKSCRTFPFF